MIRTEFPFTAIVGQEDMRLALVLAAVDPSLAGVLLSGHKGTGKSTAVRALARLLPPAVSDLNAAETRRMPLVELPLGATEDRVTGSLHIERALKTGERRFEPGLLAAANGGMLYVDEVNLLDDHLVDLLLDAAASGVNVVEREGISHVHPSRFILVGTMNPEEGALRPQFLDRFGLCVFVETPGDVALREEVVRRRLAFEKDPEAFRQEWSGQEHDLAERILAARKALASVTLPEGLLALAVRLPLEAGAHGHRADIVIIKAARALAALMGRREITHDDLAGAARFALPHRMKSAPVSDQAALAAALRAAMARVLGGAASARAVVSDDEQGDSGYVDEPMQIPGSAAAGSIIFSFEKKSSAETVDPDLHIQTDDMEAAISGSMKGVSGGRRRERHRSRSGRRMGNVPLAPREQPGEIAFDATMRAAAMRFSGRSDVPRGRPFSIVRSDLRRPVRFQATRTLVVFLVDASDSMGTGSRLAVAKGAALSLLTSAYRNRDRVALVVFREDCAEVLLPPTSSPDLARNRLRKVTSGGATPLSHGLQTAWDLIRSERRKNPDLLPVLAILTDGEANVPLEPGRPVPAEVVALGSAIGRDGIRAVIMDAAPGEKGKALLKDLAAALGAPVHTPRRMRIQSLVRAINSEDR